MSILIFSLDDAFATTLAGTIDEAFEDVPVSVVATADEVQQTRTQRSVQCLLIDHADNAEGARAVLASSEHDAEPTPTVLLTDRPAAALPSDSDLQSLLDIRSRTAMAENPAYIVPLLRHLLTPAEQNSRSLDSDLMTLFSEHALPMFLIDPGTGTILAVNDAAVDFYGYTHGEFTELTIQDINALDADEVEDRRQKAKRGDKHHFVFPHRLKNGERRTVEVNSTPITHNGQTVLFSIVQDITARVTAQEDLRIARDHYKRLTDQNIVGIYTVEDERFTYVNPRLAEMFGVTPGEMINTSIYEFVAENDQERVRQKVRQRVEGTTQASHYTFTGVHPDRDHLRIEVHGSRIETGDDVEIVGTMLDVTDREAYEAELHRLSLALEATAHAVFITDTDSVIEYVNPAFETITGYAKEEAVGQTPAILNSGRMPDEYYERLYATIESGGVWEETIINQRQNGGFYHARQTISPVLDDAGEVTGYVAIQSDISQSQIQQQVLDVFQRILRHNLRNKLSVIQGNTALLEEDLEGTPLEAYTDDIMEAAETLEGLSEKARIVDSAIEDHELAEPTELVGLLRREQKSFANQYSGVTFEINAPDELYVGGGNRLEIAVHEIIQNAIKHCDQRPKIEIDVRADHEAENAEIVIRDNGPGVDSVELTTLAIGEETPLMHSSGLGLWLVKWTVTSIGGEVVYADNHPRGLKVTVTVPLAAVS